jgi:hypothetical protein
MNNVTYDGPYLDKYFLYLESSNMLVNLTHVDYHYKRSNNLYLIFYEEKFNGNDSQVYINGQLFNFNKNPNHRSGDSPVPEGYWSGFGEVMKCQTPKYCIGTEGGLDQPQCLENH